MVTERGSTVSAFGVAFRKEAQRGESASCCGRARNVVSAPSARRCILRWRMGAEPRYVTVRVRSESKPPTQRSDVRFDIRVRTQ
jgi:hypothetical protein